MNDYTLTFYGPKSPATESGVLPDSPDSKPDPHRTHVECRLQAENLVIEQHLQNWKRQGVKAREVESALMLWIALTSGDPAQVLVSRPDLLALISGESGKSPDSAPLSFFKDSSKEDSESEKKEEASPESGDPAALDAMAEALAKVCRKNLHIRSHRQKIDPVAESLVAAGKPPDDVYIVSELIYPTDWRYKAGQPVTLTIIEDRIEEAAALRSEWTMRLAKSASAATLEEASSRYLQHDYFRRREEE